MRLSNSEIRLPVIIGIALALRIIIILATLYLGNISFYDYSKLHDGYEYHRYAKAISKGELGELHSETTRFYPGYPLILSLFRFWWMEIVVPVGAALIVIILAAHIFQDNWIAAYLGLFTPSWLLYSSVNMSEAVFLLFMLFGLMFFLKDQCIVAGLFWGYACLVRPVGIIIVCAAVIYLLLISKERKEALLILIGPAVMLLGWILVSQYAWSDFFRNIKEYKITFSYPMRSLIEGFSSDDVMKKIYIYSNVALVLLALIFIFKDGIDFTNRLYMINLLWFLLAVIFYSVLYENRGWKTFQIFDRMVISFLPPVLYSIRSILPKKIWALVIIGLLSAGLVIYWNLNLISAWKLSGKFLTISLF